MALKNNWRLYIVLILVGFSLFSILSPYVFSKAGVVVSSVNTANKCSSINEGDKISQVSGFTISTPEDFTKAVSEIKENSLVSIVVNDGPGNCVAIKDGDLGFQVSSSKRDTLKFGTDVFGGTSFIFKSDGTDQQIEDAIGILKRRARVIGIPDLSVTREDNKLTLTGLDESKTGILFEKGNVSGRIGLNPKFLKGETKLRSGVKSYSVSFNGDSIILNSKSYKQGDTFELDGTKFYLLNLTNTSLNVEAEFFKNDDIISSTPSLSGARLIPQARLYEFIVPVVLTTESSEKFGNLTLGLPTVVTATQTVIDASLVVYLDGKEESRLTIPFELAGKSLQPGINIIGYKQNYQEAENSRIKILAAAQSSPLEIKLEKIGETKLDAPLQFVALSIIGIAVILVFLGPLIYSTLRKQKIKTAIFISFISLAQMAIIVGFASIAQTRLGLNWVIDFPTILGIFLAAIFSLSTFLLIHEKTSFGKSYAIRLGSKRVATYSFLLTLISFIIGFVTLFTPFRGLGLALWITLIVEYLFTNNLIKSAI